jgi:hypothetical protein
MSDECADLLVRALAWLDPRPTRRELDLFGAVLRERGPDDLAVELQQAGQCGLAGAAAWGRLCAVLDDRGAGHLKLLLLDLLTVGRP